MLAVAARRRVPAVTAWVAVALVGIVAGGWLTARNPRFHTDASPFHGRWDVVVSPAVLLPLGVAVAVVAAGPMLAGVLRWRALVVATSVAAFGWAVALSAVGSPGFSKPMTWRGEYLAGVPLVDGDFLRTFTDALPAYPTHVKGHPPGMVLVLWAVDAVGFGGAWWGAVLVVATGASAAAAVLLAVREVGGEASARRVAPYLALAPGAVWMATSGDAFFTGVGAWAVAVTVVATGRRRRAWAVAAGVLWFATLLLSYGLVLLAGPAIVVAWQRRRADVLVVTGAVAVGLLVALGVLSGFWWPAGLAATRRAYLAGWAPGRAGWVFVWLNVCAFAFAVGPAVAPALRRLRWSGAAWLVAGAVAGVALADASLLSKAEVERIWLPWVPWVVVATVSLRGRRWLAAQAATGLALQLALRSTW